MATDKARRHDVLSRQTEPSRCSDTSPVEGSAIKINEFLLVQKTTHEQLLKPHERRRFQNIRMRGFLVHLKKVGMLAFEMLVQSMDM